MIVIVMGVSGVGKTTVGRLLAERLHVPFQDADDYHRPEDRARMEHGEPLTDAERLPWIERLHEALLKSQAADSGLILACSALRAEHRVLLERDLRDVRWVHLVADAVTIARRLRGRSGGVGPELLASQFASLEPPDEAMTIDATPSPRLIVGEILRRLAEPGLGPDPGEGEEA